MVSPSQIHTRRLASRTGRKLTCRSCLGDPTVVPAGQYITSVCYTAYPYSRGSIHITGHGVDQAPDFDTGFLTHPADLAPHVWAYKRAREIARRLPAYRGELEIGHPKFPSGSKAALVSVDDNAVDGRPDRLAVPNIEYSKEDDEAIEKYIRDNMTTTWHSLGTCAMRSEENGGVVDHRLNVHGVSGLKLCGQCFSSLSAFPPPPLRNDVGDALRLTVPMTSQICPSLRRTWALTPTRPHF